MALHDYTPEEMKAIKEKNKKELNESIANLCAQETRYKDFFSILPNSYHKLFNDIFVGQIRGQKLLKAKCLDCCNFDRSLVQECEIVLCPLHQTRPYQVKN